MTLSSPSHTSSTTTIMMGILTKCLVVGNWGNNSRYKEKEILKLRILTKCLVVGDWGNNSRHKEKEILNIVV
eukprot:scaffold421280_cov72-Attheya_sp.AAC.6